MMQRCDISYQRTISQHCFCFHARNELRMNVKTYHTPVLAMSISINLKDQQLLEPTLKYGFACLPCRTASPTGGPLVRQRLPKKSRIGLESRSETQTGGHCAFISLIAVPGLWLSCSDGFMAVAVVQVPKTVLRQTQTSLMALM